MSKKYVSWGRYPFKNQKGVDLLWRDENLPVNSNFLPQGNARSYGDCCMNADGMVVSTHNLKHFISFDSATGIIRCEAGVLLKDILDVVEPQGWFLPVTPGTKYVSLGGAIANDVHGKNHHIAGTFGCHVRAFELLRSDGTRLVCTPEQNVEMFCATIGGLGLTGVMVWAEIQLKKVANSAINMETIKYDNLAEFFQLTAESDADYEYTVAWIDCLATGEHLGRGHFMRGNHAGASQKRPVKRSLPLAVPIDPPVSLINAFSLKLFNALYYNRQRTKKQFSTVHYDPFFYPLDGVKNWNRVYGPKGFLQYQFVVPVENSELAIKETLERISAANSGSFLAVLKVFGDRPSPGMLSFPRPGATLALDFPFQGEKTHTLFNQLDEVVVQAGGAIYPAKDAHMKPEHFRQYYPQAEAFKQFKDPNITSSFWQRVMESAL